MIRLSSDRTGGSGVSALQVSASQFVLLSEAVGIYLQQKGRGRPATFHRAAERACGYVVEACGDRPLDAYTKADANTFRDALIARDLAGSSLTRVFGTVRAIVNFAASEQGLSLSNPFAGVYYDRAEGVSERTSIPLESLRLIQGHCQTTDDDLRWLIAIISDTGMRLAEAAGMAKDDIILRDDGSLVAHVRPNPWRRLKTKSSARDVPLEGAARWAAERILRCSEGQFAFARYNRTGSTNANAASAALNKWMKRYIPEGCTMHGFRHSMRDRLRAVECPADIVDQIGGWQTDGVGHGYGSGYPIVVLQKWMREIT